MEINVKFICIFQKDERLPSGALAVSHMFIAIDEEDKLISDVIMDYEDIANYIGDHLDECVENSLNSLDRAAAKCRKKDV